MDIKKTDITWNYLSTIISISTNILMLPLIVYFLDSNMIGLWGVYVSISSVVILLDFGFSPTFARNIAYSWSGSQKIEKTGLFKVSKNGPNFILLKKILFASKRTYLYISLFALVVMLFLGTPYILQISKEIDFNIVIISWILYSLSIFFNIYFGYYGAYLRGVGAIKRLSKSMIYSKTIQIFVTFLLLLFGLNIIGVVSAFLVSGLLFRFFSRFYFYTYRNIGNAIKKITITQDEIKSVFFTIWHNAWRDGLVSLSNFLTSQASVIIASLFLNLSQIGVYSISLQLLTVLSTISIALYGAYQPSIQSAFVKNKVELLIKYISII